MKEIIQAKSVKGEIAAPPSKAHTLRAIIIASLAEGKSAIHKGLIAEDQEYAMKAMQQLGAKIIYDTKTGTIFVEGINGVPKAGKEVIFVGNSGLTIRFLVSILGLAKGEKEIIVDGVERMRTGRPIQDLLDALKPLGVDAVSINKNGCPPIRVNTDSFNGGVTEMPGEKSSQYFSSILVAAPYAKKDVTVKTLGALSSRPYIGVTIDSMNDFGVKAENKNYEEFFIQAGQKYLGKEIDIEGDYSNAAYFFAATALLGGKIKVTNLKKDSAQGDKIFVDIMERMGCVVNWQKDFVEMEIKGAESLKGVGEIDMNDYPDIVMPVAVVAAFAQGETKITNIEHLRIKESDRLTVTVNALKQLGADVEGGKDFILVRGHNGQGMHGAEIDSQNDHRIVMSFAVAGLRISGIKILREEAVGKSFPEFFSEIEKVLKR